MDKEKLIKDLSRMASKITNLEIEVKDLIRRIDVIENKIVWG
jgi:hypothetical protein